MRVNPNPVVRTIQHVLLTLFCIISLACGMGAALHFHMLADLDPKSVIVLLIFAVLIGFMTDYFFHRMWARQR